MKVFALADLHLEGGQNKPMSVFGPCWENHRQRIELNWHTVVSTDDIVLVPGDLSWAMYMMDVIQDIEFLHSLPGRKVLLRGNHDYWWSSPTKLRAVLPQDIMVIQNDAVLLDGIVICGTRGWNLPGSSGFSKEDEKIYARELIRLELSLNAANRLTESSEVSDIILMMHFPPIYAGMEQTKFTDIIDRFPIGNVVYGHLHAQSHKLAFNGERNGKSYALCSADYVSFCPRLIVEK